MDNKATNATNAKQELTLQVFPRKSTGRNESHRVRQSNLIPAVVYGPKLKAALPVSLVPNEVKSIWKKAGKTGLVTLEAMDGAPAELKGTKVLFKDLQTHAFKNQLMHVDLHQLDLGRKIRVTVPLQFVGKAKGLAEGGLMSIASREVEIKCVPTEIPSTIEVDITDVGMNDSIHIDDLAKKMSGAKFEFIYDANIVLMAIVPPEEEKAATPAADAAAATAAPGAAAPGAPAAGAAAPAAAAKAGDKAAAPAKK
jgi:large subunit ribosomal protein L25